jgi:hypothetical protein
MTGFAAQVHQEVVHLLKEMSDRMDIREYVLRLLIVQLGALNPISCSSTLGTV